jgi:hypothetical protein
MSTSRSRSSATVRGQRDMVGWGQTPSHGCTEPESRVTDRMRDTADTHDRARIVNNATHAAEQMCRQDDSCRGRSRQPPVRGSSRSCTTRCWCHVWFERQSSDEAVKSCGTSKSIDDRPTSQGYGAVIASIRGLVTLHGEGTDHERTSYCGDHRSRH